MGVVLSNFRLTFSAVCAILPLSAQLLLWGFADAAYPREGTVTDSRRNKVRNALMMQLSPARGRLPSVEHVIRDVQTMQLIPARGRLR